MVRIVMSVGNDDVIEEVDAHHFTGPFDVLGQDVVAWARLEIAWRVVMTNGEDGAVNKNRFFHDDTNIDRCLCNAAMRDLDLFDEPVILIHEQHPELLDIEILH